MVQGVSTGYHTFFCSRQKEVMKEIPSPVINPQPEPSDVAVAV
jgi:hypothetical protein